MGNQNFYTNILLILFFNLHIVTNSVDCVAANLPGANVARRIADSIRERCTPEDVLNELSELPNPLTVDEGDSSSYNPLKIDVFVQTLLQLGMKSFSHSFAAISKFHYVFKVLAESEEAQICVLRSMFELWHNHQQVISFLMVIIFPQTKKTKMKSSL